MSNAVNPVYGNDGFQKVKSSDQVAQLNASQGSVVNLYAQNLEVGLLNQKLQGLGGLYQVVGYAPLGFATSASGDAYFLNNVPASAPATSVSSAQLLVLPVGARVVQAVVTNNGVTIVSGGASTYDIGTVVWNIIPPASNNITSAMTKSTINSGGVVGAVSGLTTLTSAGAPLTANAAVVANTGVTVQTLSTANTAGDLAVTLWYLL